MERQAKTATVEEALAPMKDGDTLMIGGSLFHNKPMALVRHIAHRRLRDLTVMSVPQGSIDIDLLIAAGCVAEVRVPYVGFEYLGMAHQFRRAAEAGAVRVWDCDETHLIAGLEATAKNFPSMAVKAGVGTDLPRFNPDLKQVSDPFTGEPMIAVAAIRPDFCILHAAYGDRFGNLQYAGYGFADVLSASATKRCGGIVVASVDELIPTSLIERDPRRTEVPSFLVDRVVHAAWGAHPCSSHGHYQYDEAFLSEYLAHSKAGGERLQRYLREQVDERPAHHDYLQHAVTPARLADLRKDIYA